VKVSAEIDAGGAIEKRPISGTIFITHDQQLKVDSGSFLMGQKSLEAEFVKEVKVAPDQPLIISIYRFQLPAQPSGLYVLPAVSVRVGGKEYRSVRASYEVGTATDKQAPVPTPSSAAAPTPAVPNAPASGDLSQKPSLKLEASVDGKTTLYPGQRTSLVYRFYYSGHIDLTGEVLPMLDADGLVKIGEKEIKDYTQGGLSVNEIVQEVEAAKPGSYIFGPSRIEGYAYELDRRGKKQYLEPKLASEAPAVVITVAPFEGQDKPASFNGAVGQFEFEAHLLSADRVEVGDEISLALIISGSGNLASVPLPDVCCQPGFSGFFRLSDLPPDEDVEGNQKRGIVKLRPLAASIKEIPSVEFSFFDPKASKYVVLHSDPIPITVLPAKQAPVQDLDKEAKPVKEVQPKVYSPAPIEIEGILSLNANDLHDKPFGTWWALGIWPFGIALILYQLNLRAYWEEQRKRIKTATSEELLQNAWKQPEGSALYFSLLNRALKLSLVESKLITSEDVANEDLPDGGIAGQVRSFLGSIDEKRFAGKMKLNYPELRSKAEELWQQVKKAQAEGEASP
jgi:hypothetical protein